MSHLTTSSNLSRRKLFGATAGTAAVVATAPALAGSFRPVAFSAPTAAASGVSAIEILSDEIVTLVQKRRVVNTAIDKLKATLAYNKKFGSTAAGKDPYGLNAAKADSLAAQASLGIDAGAISTELAAREAIDGLIGEKMQLLKSQITKDASLASLQRNTLEGARTEMLVAV